MQLCTRAGVREPRCHAAARRLECSGCSLCRSGLVRESMAMGNFEGVRGGCPKSSVKFGVQSLLEVTALPATV